MKYSFVSYLGTDNFLPGILTLNASLKKYNPKYDLVVLVSDLVSDSIVRLLALKNIHYKLVKQIINPHNLGQDERGFRFMYTKLRIFDLFEFDKVVYLDADLLVCANIEELFQCQHMSAVAAGSLYPGNESWKDLNAGFLVIEPSRDLFEKLYLSINHFPSSDGSDQGFLHSFFNEWPSDKKLHLDHKYNVPSTFIDEYCRLHPYKFEYKRKKLATNISIIHYWGRYKPWEIDHKLLKRKTESKWEQSLILWWDVFLEAAADVYY